MAHSKPTSWQPARSSRKRDAALKPQIDLDDVAFLPEQHRPPPPEPTTRLLRNVGVCGGVAVLLFATFAFISVTMPPDVAQGVCRPSTNQCPVGHLGPSSSPAPKPLPMPTPSRLSTSPSHCAHPSSLLLSRLCPAVTIAWRAAVRLEPRTGLRTLLPSPTQLSTPLKWVGSNLPALNVAWRVLMWLRRHSGQLKAPPPRFDATLEWFGDFIKWKGPGTTRSQPNRADTSMPPITPPTDRSQATNAPSGSSSRLRAADFFDATSTPQVGSVRSRQELQPSPSLSASPEDLPDSISPPHKLSRPDQAALVPERPSTGTAQPNTVPRSVSLPTTLISTATPTQGTHSNHSSPSPSNDTSSVQPRPRPTVARRTPSAQLPFGPARLPSADFACPVQSCGANVNNSSVVTHLRNKHSVAELTADIIDRFRITTCPVCGKPYGSPKMAADHARSMHSVSVSTRRVLSPASRRQPSPPRVRTPATDTQDSPRSTAAGPSRPRTAVTTSTSTAQASASSDTVTRQPQVSPAGNQPSAAPTADAPTQPLRLPVLTPTSSRRRFVSGPLRSTSRTMKSTQTV